METDKSQLKSSYDCIVIGSGLGGLTASALLAKEGKSVLLVEQADKYGGYGQSLAKDGFVFDYAIHSIFSWGFMKGLLEELGEKVEHGVVSSRRGDHIVFPGDDYWATTIDHMKESLSEKFPEEAETICCYFDDLVGSMSLALEFKEKPSMQTAAKLVTKYPKLWESSLEEVLNSYFKSDRLKAFVYGTHDAYLYDYAWHYSAYHLFHIKYINEGHAIKGGSRFLMDAFVRAIHKFGGDTICNTLAKKIIVKEGVACGVQLEDGTVVNAKDAVVSNADARLTLTKMLDFDTLPEGLKRDFKKWDSSGPSLSYYIVNLGLDIDLKKEYGMEYDLTLYFPSYDLPRIHKDINAGFLPDDFWLWMVFPSVNDPTVAPEGCSTAILSILVPYDIENSTGCNPDYFDGFRAINEKGEKYYLKKEEIAERMIKRAEDVLPGLGKHIVVKETWTPQNFEEFTLNYKGSTMGFRVMPPNGKDKQYMSKLGLPIKTELKGLYLAGHWTELGLSTASVVQAGRFAAYDILGKPRPPVAVSNPTDRVVHFDKEVRSF